MKTNLGKSETIDEVRIRTSSDCAPMVFQIETENGSAVPATLIDANIVPNASTRREAARKIFEIGRAAGTRLC